jgi:hypothetical protein
VHPKAKSSGAPASSKLPTSSDAPTRAALDRIATMTAALDYARRVLADRTTSREKRTQHLAFIDRVWSAHTGIDDDDDNAPLLVIADAVETAKTLDRDDLAIDAFALVYESKGLGDIEASQHGAILDAVRAARRRRGERANGAPSKSEALRLLVMALGFGSYGDPVTRNTSHPSKLANMIKERRARSAGKRKGSAVTK